MDCKHVHLKQLEGSLNANGKTYKCANEECGEQFVVEPLVIGVQFGKMPEKE